MNCPTCGGMMKPYGKDGFMCIDCGLKSDQPSKKFCPILGGSCLEAGCAWFNEHYKICGIRMMRR